MSIAKQRVTPTLVSQSQTNMPTTNVISESQEDEVSGKEYQRNIDTQFYQDIDPIKTLNSICKAHAVDHSEVFHYTSDRRPFVVHPTRKRIVSIPGKFCSTICPREIGEEIQTELWETSMRLVATSVEKDVASLAPEHQEVISAFTTANTLEVTSTFDVELTKEDSAHRGAPTICQSAKPWTPAEVVVRMLPSLFDTGTHALKLPETDKFQLILNGINADGEADTHKISMLTNMIAKYVFLVDMTDAVKFEPAAKKAVWISNVRDVLFAVSNDRAFPVVDNDKIQATPARESEVVNTLVKEYNRRVAETSKDTPMADFEFKTGIFYTCTIDSVDNPCIHIAKPTKDHGWRNLQQAPQVLIRAWKQVTQILVGESYVPQIVVKAVDNPKDTGCTPDALVDRAIVEYINKFTSVSTAAKSGMRGPYSGKKLAVVANSWRNKYFLCPCVDVETADNETKARPLFNGTVSEKAFLSVIETRMNKADAKAFTPTSFAAVVKQFKPVFEALLFIAARMEPKSKTTTVMVHAASSRKRKGAEAPNETSGQEINAKHAAFADGVSTIMEELRALKTSGQEINAKYAAFADGVSTIMEELRALKEEVRALKKKRPDPESDDEVMLASQAS